MNILRNCFIIICTLFSIYTKAQNIDFTVAEINPSHLDSYIITLSNPSDLAQARAFIQHGASIGQHIINVTIATGADGKNRDYLKPGQPLWSWHITAFNGFSDAAIELCDGTPSYIEHDIEGWIKNSGGAVCLWSYTIVEEITSGDGDGDPNSCIGNCSNNSG